MPNFIRDDEPDLFRSALKGVCEGVRDGLRVGIMIVLVLAILSGSAVGVLYALSQPEVMQWLQQPVEKAVLKPDAGDGEPRGIAKPDNGKNAEPCGQMKPAGVDDGEPKCWAK